MIRYLYATELIRHPGLAAGMFRDRATQFRDRLGWPVSVDEDGAERDQYDALNPLYVILEDRARHAASLRFLPTTGRTMVNEHFTDILGGGTIRSPLIWECTRFCLSPDGPPQAARRLLRGALEIGVRSGLSDAVGVFDHGMGRVYRRLGWQPTILGERDGVCVGLWSFDPALRDRLGPLHD